MLLVQARAGNRAVAQLLALQRYRKPGAQNFGAADGTFTERAFKSRTKQPWISLITVELSSVVIDNGVSMPKGTATATYFPNAHALAPITLPVTGGPKRMRSDPGTFTVHRIEGVGYNDPAAAAEMFAAKGAGALEGPKRGRHRRYTKPQAGERPIDVEASMHLAIFYNRGEALHFGNVGEASHGCVHVGDFDVLTQMNYHSVIGLTKVKVVYSGLAKAAFAP